MSTAIDMYVFESNFTQWWDSFSCNITKAHNPINVDSMTAGELLAKLKRGYDDIGLGNTRPAKEVYAKFREEKVDSV